jgi:hypothetical protein
MLGQQRFLRAGSIMSSKLDYAEAVKQAEAAVASVKDSDLKGIAFGKVLDALLGQGSQSRASGHARHDVIPSQKGPATRAKAKGGPKGYVERLIDDGFFKAPKTLAAVRAELGNGGHHIPLTSLSRPMMILCRERRLRRQKVKDGKKQVFTYSNW